MTKPLAVLMGALTPRLRLAGGVSAVLLVAERALGVLATVDLVSGARGRAVALGVVLAVLVGVRGAVRAVIGARVHERLHGAATRALLEGDVLRASALPEIDAHTAVVEGTYHGVHLVADLVPALAGDALASAVLAAVVVATQPPWALAAVGLGFAFAAAGLFAARAITARMSERAWQAYEPVSEDLASVLGGRLEIVAAGRRDAFGRAALERLARWRALWLRADAVGAVVGRAPFAAAVLGLVVVVAAGGRVGTMLADLELGRAAIVASALPAFLGFAHAAHGMARYRVRVAPLVELLVSEAAPRGATPGAAVTPPVHIEWRDVTFAYTRPDGRRGPDVLSRETIRWDPGQVLVLAGPNGCGKSTTLRLLLGLAKPQSGSIRVGDSDLFELDLDAWRRHIAYLPQRPYLPDRASVRDAVRLLASDASDAAIRDALVRVGLWGALSEAGGDPLDVRVGTLSIGQRQRVALARVLTIDAPILLLDEPDANLDAAGIRLVRDIVRDLAPRKMIAVVAHTTELVDLAGMLVTLHAAA